MLYLTDVFRYPRAGTLGGCVSHNALIFITPDQSDWNTIASITGDDTWVSFNSLAIGENGQINAGNVASIKHESISRKSLPVAAE